MRIAYLGPEGTFSHQALLDSQAPSDAIAEAQVTIYDTVMSVHDGSVDLALVPIENAIEGSVDITLDTLAGDAGEVTIVGERLQPINNCLIAGGPLALEAIETVHSHPQPLAQCARFLRTRLPGARIVAASSTAEAVRAVSVGDAGRAAALGNRLAAELYGGHVLLADVDDVSANVTRFVWLARRDRAAEVRGLVERGAQEKTSIVFWGGGDQASGWLVSCLAELSEREVNLTRIESRPRRIGFGHYMFFVDLSGNTDDSAVAAAIDGLEDRCEEVRVLGSYRTT